MSPRLGGPTPTTQPAENGGQGEGSTPTQRRGRLGQDGVGWTAPPRVQNEREACGRHQAAVDVRVSWWLPSGSCLWTTDVQWGGQFGGFRLRFLFNEEKKHRKLCLWTRQKLVVAGTGSQAGTSCGSMWRKTKVFVITRFLFS